MIVWNKLFIQKNELMAMHFDMASKKHLISKYINSTKDLNKPLKKKAVLIAEE